jgi:quercetin dioxygenase-like cupin family protein
MHSHTNDVSIVVLKGAYLYRDEAGEKRVGPGEFLRIPGGHRHWSGGDAKEGALFYQHSTAKFDLVPAK